MTAFYSGAAALLIAACAFVLWPLLRAGRTASRMASREASSADGSSAVNLAVLREQQVLLDADFAAARIDAAQHGTARCELERRVLEEDTADDAAPRTGRVKALAVMLGLAVPLFAVGLYARLGNTAGLVPQTAAQPAATEADVVAMVEKLAQRMQARPDDAKGWVMLGRSYAALQRFPDSGKAYARALALTPDDAQLLVDYADVLAAVAQSAAGEPTKLVMRALQIEPGNLKALALAGSAAFERKDFAGAIAYWTQARAAAPSGSEFAQGLDSSLAEARAAARPGDAGAPPATAPASPTAAATAATAAAATAAATAAAPADTAAETAANTHLVGRVSLAPALAARVAADDTVFIYARAAEGPRMPLAIQRRKASELPISFTLDDSMAMAPDMKLSKFGSVFVEARISKSGDAMAKAGDLRGQLGPLKPGSAGLALVIDSVQP